MKVFVETDLEGVAGVTTFYVETMPDGRYYEQARRLLTAEINAAVDGLLEAGVGDVLVSDGHGPGAVLYEDLHPSARLAHGRPLAPRMLDNFVAGCDAAIFIGLHAMAGTRDGNMNHTQSSKTIDSFRLNGKPIGEFAQCALHMGSLGIPLIFASGDAAACREAGEFMPGIVTAEVKVGLGRNSAISLSRQESHRRIREGVKRAVEQQRARPLKPLVWPGPYVIETRYFHTDVADAAAQRAGAERVDSQTVRLRSNSIAEIIYG